MQKRIIATAAGVGASLAGVVLWVVLYFLGFIAGIAGALMGIGFIMAYRVLNKEDTSKYPIFIGALIIPFEIIIAELIALALLAATEDVSFALAIADSEIQLWIVIDVVVGLVLSYAAFGGYLYSAKRKNQLAAKRASAPVSSPVQKTYAPINNNPDNGAAQPAEPAPAAEKEICASCGSEVIQSEPFCPNCGASKKSN